MAMAFVARFITVLLCAGLTRHASAASIAGGSDGFLGGPPEARRVQDEAVSAALAAVAGCGGPLAAENAAGLVTTLQRIWRPLPKNKYGRAEWGLMRYVAHRYFIQRYNLLVRGLEPVRALDAAENGTARVLEGIVLGETLKDKSLGFSFDDAMNIIAAIEKLIKDQAGSLLASAYLQRGKSVGAFLGRDDLAQVIQTYMVFWMIGNDSATVEALLANPALLEESVPHWLSIADFVAGSVRAMEFRRGLRQGGSTMHAGYSFEDALEVTNDITTTFASFWEAQCQEIKDSLVALDKNGIGRIRLSDFYGANLDGQWRFGESEAYLRELGALDETSTWRGKQVIIPNYLQGANNCIVTTENYFVCCNSECETVLNDIEDSIGAPLASPEEISSLVGNMTNFNDDAPPLDRTLKMQLTNIARVHGGKVPLHGRLFAQWLHYVFPQECPFPHRVGKATVLAPAEFGNYEVSEDEVRRHAASRQGRADPGLGNASARAGDGLEETRHPWMSQWEEEEELIGDYSLHLAPPWKSVALRGALPVAAALTLLLGWAAGALQPVREKDSVGVLFASPTDEKRYHV